MFQSRTPLRRFVPLNRVGGSFHEPAPVPRGKDWKCGVCWRPCYEVAGSGGIWKHKGKFNNRKVEYSAGSEIWYDSQAEGNYALPRRRTQGRPDQGVGAPGPGDAECQRQTITVYVVDFLVVHKDHREWVEMKDGFTQTALLKIRLFRALYPNRKYTLIRSTGWS